MASSPGYSDTPLPTKLGIKDAHTVFLDRLPATLDLGDLPGHVVRRLPLSADVTLTFHDRLADLTRRLPELFERTVVIGMVWVCWPKKASRMPTDLDENLVRDLGLRLGFVDVKVAAIDETWSGLKFVRRLRAQLARGATPAGQPGE